MAKTYICEEKGCNETKIVHCWNQDWETGEWHHSSYCWKHCHDNGFCPCCGQFWGGIERFDFGNPSGLCEICLDQLKCEVGDYDDYDDYYEDYYDFPEYAEHGFMEEQYERPIS